MTSNEKIELISAVNTILEIILKVDDNNSHETFISEEGKEDAPMEMLTVRECASLVTGLTEHTVRMLVKQGKVRYIRCGEGARGKILVSKESLLKYLGAAGV